VPVQIHRQGAGFRCVLSAPEALSIGKAVDATLVAAAVSVSPTDIVMTTHPPQVASVGLPFLFAEVRDRAVLGRMKVNAAGFEAVGAQGVPANVLYYARSQDDFDIRARMFAPLDGILEDPATGSANCALGALLAHYQGAGEGTFAVRIAQGVEMGRPSVLLAEADKRGGRVVAARIGGDSVLVCDGYITVETG
jgi:trans-2,3-dihydro-3-hydroxyanthranilate isomerase